MDCILRTRDTDRLQRGGGTDAPAAVSHGPGIQAIWQADALNRRAPGKNGFSAE